MSAYELAQLNIGIIKGPIDGPVMRKPGDRFEELLRLFEMVLALEV